MRILPNIKKRIIQPKFIIENNISKQMKLLNEELGAFNGQYHMANIIADTAINMIRQHRKTNESDFPFKKYKWKRFRLEIEYSEDSSFLFLNTTATFNGCNDDVVAIIVKLSRNDVLSLTENELKHKLVKIIAHELNHGYTVISTYNNSGHIPNYPNFYSKIVDIIQDNSVDNNSFLYKLSYAIYVTSYIEMPAFVSQTVPQLVKKLKDKCSYDEFKNAIIETEAYEIYHDILEDIVPQIRKSDVNSLIQEFAEYSIIFSKNDLDKIIDEIENNAKKAIKNIVRNAMRYFYEHVETKNKKINNY